ncbi:MAG: hypothetical protein IPG50_20540 [Myxococcales bacterium]|nr:hypothetical protein [Myxococcales bacterium]
MSTRPLARCVGVAASLAVVVAGAAVTSQARADDVSCAVSAETAQSLRREKKLLRARDELVKCSDPKCPSFVRGDCVRWLEELKATLPTVVVRAVDGAGNDVLSARVRVDQTLDASLGVAVPLDPGPHVITVESAGARGEAKLLVAEAEKSRVVVVPLTASSAGAGAPAKPTPEALSPGPSPWAYVAGGVGAAGLVTFGVLQLVAQGEYDDLKKECGNACEPSRVDPIRTKVVASAVALGVGVLGSGVSLWLFTRPRSSAVGGAANVSVAPTADGGVATRLRVRF